MDTSLIEQIPNLDQLRQFQSCLLGILKAIDKVCNDHHLRYFLMAGTCLGAIRHGGFIPWDDDADIGLPRPDYEQFVSHANEWLPEGYELVSGAQNPRYPYFFARVQDARTTYVLRRRFDFVGGVPVDVYPIDGMTSNALLRRLHYMRLSLAKKKLYFCLVDPYKHGHGPRSWLPLVARKMYSPATLHRKLQHILTAYSYDNCGLVADHDYKPGKGVFDKAVFGTPQAVDFADAKLTTVSQPDAYLRQLYGHYMAFPSALPPQNSRFVDLATPYREWLRLHAAEGLDADVASPEVQPAP